MRRRGLWDRSFSLENGEETTIGEENKGSSCNCCADIHAGCMQVRIKVAASSLNFADVLQVQGLYQEKPKLPFVPGGEVSGEVIEIGRKVKSIGKGDLVIPPCSQKCIVFLCQAYSEIFLID